MLSAAGVVAAVATAMLLGWRDVARQVRGQGLRLAVVLLLFGLADWALLWALPQLRLSFSPEIRPPLIASILVRLLIFWGLLGALLLARRRASAVDKPGGARTVVLLYLLTNLGLSVVQLDAYVVEPLWVETTSYEMSFDGLDPQAAPLRIVHLADPHIERNSYREADVVRRVNALQPDIIVFSGDYLNLSYLDDPVSADHFRQFIGQLEAPSGIYAVRGSVDSAERMAELLEGSGVVWLEQQAVVVEVRGQAVTLVGVACSHHLDVDSARLTQALQGVSGDGLTVLLYHSPDLIAEAAERGIDLYLAGHTHGGQIRLPLIGPLFTGSIYGRRYAAGRFVVEGTTLIVSRGLGFEGGGMPRARFLCRPEIVYLELG